VDKIVRLVDDIINFLSVITVLVLIAAGALKIVQLFGVDLGETYAHGLADVVSYLGIAVIISVIIIAVRTISNEKDKE